MMDFMKAGGYGMWLILVLGTVTMYIAGSFAWQPTERKLGLVRPLSASLVFMSLANTFAGIAMTMKYVTKSPDFATNPKLPFYVLVGVGESVSSIIFAFGILAVVWILAAFGLRRQI